MSEDRIGKLDPVAGRVEFAAKRQIKSNLWKADETSAETSNDIVDVQGA
jgi:hypothetical protein